MLFAHQQNSFLLARAVVLFCLGALFATPGSQAQELGGRFGIGGQIGDPSGFTVKLYRPTDTPLDIFIPVTALDLLVAWDLDDFYFLNAHVLSERPLESSPLRYFVGPGLLAGLQGLGEDTEPVIGLTGTLGVNFFTQRFEVFMQVTPRLILLPKAVGEFGGGVGLRYFF